MAETPPGKRKIHVAHALLGVALGLVVALGVMALASRSKAELEVLLPGAEAPRVRLGEAFGSKLGVDSRQAADDVPFVRVRILLLANHTAVTPTYHDDD